MKIGVTTFAQNFSDWERHLAGEFERPPKVSDSQVYDDELRLAELVEPLGFDSLWTVEHHFTPYTMVPRPAQFLAFMAGRTRRIDFGTMVIVLPWHDPVTIAEEISQLDNLLQGRRVTLGFGRGAGKVEFDGMRIPMGESRARFLEALEIVRRALREERFSFEGEHFRIPPLSIRPRPRSADLLERMYCAWGSPETVEIAARAELGPLFIPQKSWEEIAGEMRMFNGYREEMGLPPHRPIVVCWAYCGESEQEARETTEEYMENYGRSAFLHYGFHDAKHFEEAGGYDHYAKAARQLSDRSAGTVTGFSHTQVWGTPETCLEKLHNIRQTVGAGEFVGCFLFGALPPEKAERSMRLFADKVLPTVQADF